MVQQMNLYVSRLLIRARPTSPRDGKLMDHSPAICRIRTLSEGAEPPRPRLRGKLQSSVTHWVASTLRHARWARAPTIARLAVSLPLRATHVLLRHRLRHLQSAIAIPRALTEGPGMRLVPLEGEHLTMPTAVFYCTDADDLPPGTWRGTHFDDSLPRTFGRAAVQAYIEGLRRAPDALDEEHPGHGPGGPDHRGGQRPGRESAPRHHHRLPAPPALASPNGPAASL